MKREGKVSVRHGGKWVGCNILWVQMRRTASVEEAEGKKKKKADACMSIKYCHLAGRY